MDANFVNRLVVINENLLYLFARLNYNEVLFNKMVQTLTSDYANNYRDVRSLNLENWDKLSEGERYGLFVEQCQINSEIRKMLEKKH